MNGYVLYAPKPSVDFRCPLCFEDGNTDKTETVSHGGCGDLHPVHKECAKILALYRSICPICRAHINAQPLVPWRRRVVTEVGAVIVDVMRGVSGAAIATSGVFWGVLLGHFFGSTKVARALIPMMGGAGFFLVLGTLNPEPARNRRAEISRIVAAALFGGVIGTATGISLPVMAAVVGTGTVLAVANGVFERYFA